MFPTCTSKQALNKKSNNETKAASLYTLGFIKNYPIRKRNINYLTIWDGLLNHKFI